MLGRLQQHGHSATITHYHLFTISNSSYHFITQREGSLLPKGRVRACISLHVIFYYPDQYLGVLAHITFSFM